MKKNCCDCNHTHNDDICECELENKYQYAKRIINTYLIVEKKMLEDDLNIKTNYVTESIEIAIEALEKQISKKPIEHTKLPNNRFSYLCPTCNRLYWDREFLGDYCSSCGQKFDLD